MHTDEPSALLAHDIRGALAAVSLSAEAILERAQDALVADAARGILRAVDTIDSLCRDACEPGSAPAAGTRLSDVLADIRAVAGAPRGGLRSLRTEAEGDPDLGWRAAPVFRVLSNLVLNAGRHRAGAEGAAVAVRCAVGAGVLRIRVADDGPGLPGAVAARLRGAASAPERGRRGLGLRSVADCLDRLGGRMELLSSGPRGTDLLVLLPLAGAGRARVAPGPARRGAAPARGEPPALPQFRRVVPQL
jgi:signal transduction histidine kinase